MSVGAWVSSRLQDAPPALSGAILAALATDAGRESTDVPAACLRAAQRTLADIVTLRRFGRDDALALLAVDALVTLAYEHASESVERLSDLRALANTGAEKLTALAS